MTYKEIESVLENMGWVNTKKTISTEGNDSVYILWINSQGDEVYVGSYYIEIDTQPIAYPYRDAGSTKKELIKFLNQ